MLRGELVELRPMSREDVKDQYRWRNDPEVSRWASGSPFWGVVSLESLERMFEYSLENRSQEKEYMFSIYTLDGKHIGDAGYRDVDRVSGTVTIGLSIGERGYWDQGYGTDATKTFVKFLFRDMNLRRVQLDTWSGNARAIRCYEKCGFQIEGRLRKNEYVRGEYYDTVVMGLLRDECTYVT